MIAVANFFALVGRGDDCVVLRLVLSSNSQDLLGNVFSSALDRFLHDEVELVPFDGTYRPDESEILVLPNFELPQQIEDAVQDPATCERLVLSNDSLPPIKAIFTRFDEPSPRTCFQAFRQSQFLTRRGFSLIFSDETFTHLESPGLTINEDLTCVFDDQGLTFRNFIVARQIFDLSSYYREATDSDVADFLNIESIRVADEESFGQMADSWVRRKLALIRDRQILENFSPSEIARIGHGFGLSISVETDGDGEFLCLPEEKPALKQLLRFLDEDIYSGPMTETRYLTNNKRVVD